MLAYELILRLAVFLGVFLALLVLETAFPRKPRAEPRQRRWATNLITAVLGAASLRLLAIFLPFLAVGAAVDAWQSGWGLFNQLAWPLWAEIVLSLVLFDFAIWLQHVVTHKVPFLWRFHRAHHADRDMDATTAIRFHPIEIFASMLVKIGLVYVIGPPWIAVIVFEILLNATALFGHANLRLPRWLDAILRLVLVTPDMHRIHHSMNRIEHDSNYGFALSIWDRLFRTYRSEPELGHAHMKVGLEWQNEQPSRLRWTLLLPFKR